MDNEKRSIELEILQRRLAEIKGSIMQTEAVLYNATTERSYLQNHKKAIEDSITEIGTALTNEIKAEKPERE